MGDRTCLAVVLHSLPAQCAERSFLPPPAGISLSPDGLWVATATDSGALSLLDVAARRYSPLLRSHTAAVHAIEPMAQLPGEPQQQRRYCTAGADGTVRVWDASGHQQLLELTAPGETVLRCVW